MSLTATFYHFHKRHNSTLVPDNTVTSQTFDIDLKDDCSLVNPTFFFKKSDSAFKLNYCSFEGRYYFVEDVTSVRNNLWEVSCRCDVLATYKEQIEDTYAFIQYCTGGTGLNNIVDNRIPVGIGSSVSSNVAAVDSFIFSTFPIVILSLTGSGSSGLFVLDSWSSIPDILNGVDNWWGSAVGTATVYDDIVKSIKQLFTSGGAASCIKNAIGLPIAASGISLGAATTLSLGAYPTNVTGYALNQFIKTSTSTVVIPWQHTDWRRNSPYTKIELFLPCLGNLSIDATEVSAFPSLDIDYSLNLSSGDMAARVRGSGSNVIVGMLSGNIAQGISIGSSNTNYSGVIGGLATAAAATAGAVASGGLTLAGAGVIAAGAAASLGSINGQSQGFGNMSGGASVGVGTTIICSTICANLAHGLSNLDARQGMPLMAVDKIENHSGYIQTVNASVGGGGNITDAERREINSLLDGGIYYE